MSTDLAVPGPGDAATLDELADIANSEHELATGAVESMVAHAIRAGEALTAAKAQLPHGEWLPWLEVNFRATRQTATKYMQVASNGNRGFHLKEGSIRQALKQLARAPADTVSPAEPYVPTEAAPDLFATIVIDPPWRYDNRATRGAAEDHYQTMSLDDLAAMQLPSADDAHLYLWVTNPFLREGFTLMDTWGFTYKTCLTWIKPQMGMGNYFRSMTEHVLFGLKGRCPTLRKDVGTWFQADRTQHSAKPDAFYDLVETCSPGPRLDMFARTRRFGWHTWGNEA